jgi:hypothetical protein
VDKWRSRGGRERGWGDWEREEGRTAMEDPWRGGGERPAHRRETAGGAAKAHPAGKEEKKALGFGGGRTAHGFVPARSTGDRRMQMNG